MMVKVFSKKNMSYIAREVLWLSTVSSLGTAMIAGFRGNLQLSIALMSFGILQAFVFIAGMFINSSKQKKFMDTIMMYYLINISQELRTLKAKRDGDGK